MTFANSAFTSLLSSELETREKIILNVAYWHSPLHSSELSIARLSLISELECKTLPLPTIVLNLCYLLTFAVLLSSEGACIDIDWYVYLKVWKLNYVISSTHAHFKLFHPGRWDRPFIWEIFIPRPSLWSSRQTLPRSQ